MIQQSHICSHAQKKKKQNKQKKNRKQGRAQIFIHQVHSSTIHNSQKAETTQMFIGRWMDEQYVCVHPMEQYLALKVKEICTPTITWVNLEDVMWSEISQAQKEKYCMVPVTWSSWTSHIHRQKAECVLGYVCFATKT